MLPRHLLAVPLLLGLSAGCGGTGNESAPEPTETSHITISTPTSTPTVSATPTPTPTPTPRPTPTPTPTPTQSDQGGNGDADETVGPATAGGGICGKLSAAEVGRVLGGTVQGKALGGAPGCVFSPADPHAYAATLTPAKTMAAARDEATSAVEGTPQDVPGVGAEAFVVTGTMFGGEDVQGAGAVRVGTRVVSVALNQEKGLPAAQVRDRLVALLRLVASQGG